MPHGRPPKHFRCIKKYSSPLGDIIDIIMSSRRDTSEKTTLTAASVTTMPALRMSRTEELHTNLDEFDEILAFEQVVVWGTTVKCEPKFEPNTLMLLKPWVETATGEGVL